MKYVLYEINVAPKFKVTIDHYQDYFCSLLLWKHAENQTTSVKFPGSHWYIKSNVSFIIRKKIDSWIYTYSKS